MAVDYFQVKYGPGSTIIFDMSLTYILAAFGAVLLNNVLVDKLSLNTRICFGKQHFQSNKFQSSYLLCKVAAPIQSKKSDEIFLNAG